MSNSTKRSLATRHSGEPQLPAGPPRPGSTLARFAQMVLDNSKKAGRKVADSGGSAARKARFAAGRALKQAPEHAIDVFFDEGAAMASHAGAHFLHRQLGGVGVGFKGGMELLALVVGKLSRVKPRTMRGMRASLQGTLHHTLGAYMHHKWPTQGEAARSTPKISGAEETDIGDAADEEDPGRTDY